MERLDTSTKTDWNLNYEFREPTERERKEREGMEKKRERGREKERACAELHRNDACEAMFHFSLNYYEFWVKWIERTAPNASNSLTIYFRNPPERESNKKLRAYWILILQDSAYSHHVKRFWEYWANSVKLFFLRVMDRATQKSLLQANILLWNIYNPQIWIIQATPTIQCTRTSSITMGNNSQ